MLLVNEEDKIFISIHSSQNLKDLSIVLNSFGPNHDMPIVYYDLENGKWLYSNVRKFVEFFHNYLDDSSRLILDYQNFPGSIVPVFQVKDHEEWEVLLAIRRGKSDAIILLDGDNCVGVRRLVRTQRQYTIPAQYNNQLPVVKNNNVSEKYVNVGFSERESFDPLDPNITLQTDHRYYLWIGVEDSLSSSIDKEIVSFEFNSPELRIIVFDAKDGIILDSERSWGRMIMDNGSYIATDQPSKELSNLNLRRLYFPIKTPRKSGLYTIRCNIYYKQVLLQSRLIKAEVRSRKTKIFQALNSVVDFKLTNNFGVKNLDNIENHLLSILINENSNKSQGFKFFGLSSDGQSFIENTSLDQSTLENLSEVARRTLRKISWGGEGEWESEAYRYSREYSIEQFSKDIILLAIRGYRFYYTFANAIFGDAQKIKEMQQLMRQPGYVQIAIKRGCREVIPAGLFYDYDIDTNAKHHTLCRSFLSALDANVELSETECFLGNCPSRDDVTVVCPSGFWGFRHFLGFPYSGELTNEDNLLIKYTDNSRVVISVSKDPALVERDNHLNNIQDFFSSVTCSYVDSREKTLAILKEYNPAVVYFYCHGGKINDIPFLQVGDANDPGITPDNILMKNIYWKNPQPFVFINGCNTAHIGAKSFMEFTSAFIKVANALGVMGTEVTVFEPLACKFAEIFFEHFMTGNTVGVSVRSARLTLLREMNPLGLVYTPYSVASVKIIKE